MDLGREIDTCIVVAANLAGATYDSVATSIITYVADGTTTSSGPSTFVAAAKYKCMYKFIATHV